MANNKQQVFTLQVAENGIGWITMDVPGESQNTLRAEFAAEINALLDQVESQPEISALVLISGKSDNFVAGADISVLESITTAEAASELSRTGHQMFARLETINMPVVAAINGACLGGGLELALACSHRIVTDEKQTRIGLPEVQLGVLPGGGGTQRLPRLIGIANALDLMLTGRQLVARQAKKIGLVDEVVPVANLRKAAEKLALSRVGKSPRRISEMHQGFKPAKLLSTVEWQKVLLESNNPGRDLIFNKALEKVERKTRGNYPAPGKIIECVKVGMEQGFSVGLETEAKLFGELVVSPQAEQLMNIFFATTELKKDTGVSSEVQALPVERIGVLGGGLMGAGIAFVSSDKAGKMVRIKDTSEQGINHALKYCWEIYRKRIKRNRMSLSDASRRFAKVSGTTKYLGFKRTDLIIEAVFENLELKQQMVKECEDLGGDSLIFASNTSSIPITKIAEASQRPERVIGMHYFSPVEKMPLLEIVTTEHTSDQVIATCVKVGKQQGKTVIVVKDGTGFYTSRILAPFVNEAGHLLAQNTAIDHIDKSLQDAGFPVGPLTLLDEVGIDVGTKIVPILVEKFGDRMAPPAIFKRLEDDDRKGRKNGRGFYQYTGKSKGKKQVDNSVYPLLGITPGNQLAADKIVRRCLLQMINEAVLCLQEGIIRSPRDGDIGAIFGLGFPPFLGGPFRYIDSYGADQLVAEMAELEAEFGERFKAASLLQQKAQSGSLFYAE